MAPHMLYFARFMFCNHLHYNCVCCAFKLSLVVLFTAVIAGEFGCFLWVFLTWHIPEVSSNSLNLLLVSDSQIQGYKNEPSGILGYITRLDVDWYLIKAFSLVMASFSADAVINLGDLFDEGYFAKDGEFLEYKARYDNIFKIPTEIASVYIAGDNDIGGEGLDSITKDIVARFSEHFGPINEVIKLKSFQIVKVNSLSFLRGKPFKDERWIYNETLKFFDELPSMLDKEKITILIGHVPLRSTSKRNRDQLMKLIHAIRPSYVFSGHDHEPAVFHYTFASFDVTEFVVPTCSYRMGTNKMGAALAVIGPDGSIKYSVLQLPRRYPFFCIYLAGLCLSVALASPWILATILWTLRPLWWSIFGRKNCNIKYL